MAYQQLRMIRPNLDGLPPIAVPEGCEIRTSGPGDEEAWAGIMNTGIGDDWTVEKMRTELTDKPQFDPDGLFFAVVEGRILGSACAWRASAEEHTTGTVHMVCVLPEARSRGLGYLLVLAVLHYFREHGFRQADLTTDDFRLPAIKSYLRLGFQPVYLDETHVERWRKLGVGDC